MLVILLVGMPGAGKEEFVQVAKKRGYRIVRMGDVVRDYVKSLGYPLENSIVGRIAGEERDKRGVDIWAKRTVERIKDMGGEKIVVDGIRCPEEVEVYKKNIGNVVLVGIFASQKIRYERIIKRGRSDDIKNWKEFVEREKRELSWGLGDVFAHADYMILNMSTLKDYYRQVNEFLTQLENIYFTGKNEGKKGSNL